MSAKLTIALAQLNPVMGDNEGNIERLRTARAEAAQMGADIVVVPELFVCGYPPEDLAVKPSFQAHVRSVVEDFVMETADGGPAVVLGAPWYEEGKLYNAALVIDNGAIIAKIFKRDLPNYGPFDEKRIFASGPLPEPVLFRGVKLGIVICEDIWTPDAALHLKERGAEILISPNGSPYEVDKDIERKKIGQARCMETGLPLIYVNQVGGQDELVFDGGSFACDKIGDPIVTFSIWEEQIGIVHFGDSGISAANARNGMIFGERGSIYHALMIGLRDYVRKNSFDGVVLGLSGGIDSAVAAAIAVDALGADRVWGVMMPSPYTSPESLADAAESAQMLGCKYDTIPISGAMKVFNDELLPILGGKLGGVVTENIQSRSRGLILMALSNATGHMVLSTGNKSEMAVGYTTLYGDMCGGFAVLKDVYKTQVYNIARWRNSNRPETSLGPEGKVIPKNVLSKAPTAELRPNQKDQDSLPPYRILDGILESLIERDMSQDDIIKLRYDRDTVRRVWAMLDKAEYKRRQAPPGVKITRRNLGRDRRYPITNRYKET